MPAADDFVMHGARAAMAGGMVHISEQVKSIEWAVIDNPGLAFDLSKTVVESACRTILSERKFSFATDADLPKLFKQVTKILPMMPTVASAETEIRRSLSQTLNGLHTALQGICELRNACGFASHGSDELRPAMESAQALLAAQAADPIVGFLHRLHRQESTDTELGRVWNSNATKRSTNTPMKRMVTANFRPDLPPKRSLICRGSRGLPRQARRLRSVPRRRGPAGVTTS